MDLIFCISGLQIFIVLAQKLLLGRRAENPEVGPELLGSMLPWGHVADLPWDPGSRFSSSSVPFRNFFFFFFHSSKAYSQGVAIPWEHFVEKGKCIYIKNTTNNNNKKQPLLI